MKQYDLTSFAPLFVDKEKAQKAYDDIMELDPTNNEIEVDMTGIESMTTLCGKIIFGRIAKEIGLSLFYKMIKFKGLTEEVELIINMGIHSAVEEDLK